MNATSTLAVRVVAQTPPGGRCTLYTGYGQALAKHLGARFELEISRHRDANGQGFPSIWINGSLVRPSDGVIVMPEEIAAILTATDIAVSDELHKALNAQINELLNEGEQSC